jgi:hypothetical protein
MSTNTEGPANEYGCKCVARDAQACDWIRGGFPRSPSQTCDCPCHTEQAQQELAEMTK